MIETILVLCFIASYFTLMNWMHEVTKELKAINKRVDEIETEKEWPSDEELNREVEEIYGWDVMPPSTSILLK